MINPDNSTERMIEKDLLFYPCRYQDECTDYEPNCELDCDDYEMIPKQNNIRRKTIQNRII